MIKGLIKPAQSVAGIIRIGHHVRKNGRDLPQKQDHFEVCFREVDETGNYVLDRELMDELVARAKEPGSKITLCGGCSRAKELGYPDGLPTRLGVFLVSDEVEEVFPTRLAWYRGDTAFCTGDGETAQRLEEIRTEDRRVRFGSARPHEPCGETCIDFQEGRCKPNGVLRVILPGRERTGAIHVLRTSSWRSIRNVLGSLEYLKTEVGVLRYLPLVVELNPERVQPRRGAGGAAQTAWILSIYYPGGVQELLEAGARALELLAPARAKLEAARRELLRPGLTEGQLPAPGAPPVQTAQPADLTPGSEVDAEPVAEPIEEPPPAPTVDEEPPELAAEDLEAGPAGDEDEGATEASEQETGEVVGPAELRHLAALLAGRTREEARELIVSIIQREVETARDLTRREYQLVAARLEEAA